MAWTAGSAALATLSHRSSVAALITMVAFRLLTLLVLMKVLSAAFGPEGFGVLSQIMGVAAMFYMFAGGGLTYGLIKHIAAAASREERAAWLAAGAAICAAVSAALAVVAGVLYLWAAPRVFGNAQISPVFLVIGGAQALMGAGHIALAYLSGTGDLRSFATINMIGSLLGLAFALSLARVAGFEGAAYGVAVLSVAPGLLALALLIRRARLRKPHRIWPPERQKVIELLKYSGVMAFAALAIPLAQLYIRADLAQAVGWHEVGFWQSIVRLSDAYMQVFAVLCINFLLPQLSSSIGPDRAKLLIRLAAVFIALFLLGAEMLYLLREIVVRIAFSAEFLPATDFVAPQLAGDFAKLVSAILVYYFIAEGRRWVQGGAEALQAFALVALYAALEPAFGTRSAVLGHLGSCAALAVVLIALFLIHTSKSAQVSDTREKPVRNHITGFSE